MRDGPLFVAGNDRYRSGLRQLIAFGRPRPGPNACEWAPTFVVLVCKVEPFCQGKGQRMPDSLSSELAALKGVAAHNSQRYRLLEAVRWPNAARIAVNLTVDFDAMLLRRLNNEPPMELAKGEFGGRVGIWRLLQLFARHGVKATIFTPGRICELYPAALRAAVMQGHELADHMWEHRVPKEEELARDHLRKTAAALTQFSGRPVVGSRSHYPAWLLRQEGYLYNSHGARSHRPYLVLAEAGEAMRLELPFHFALDDATFFRFAWYPSAKPVQHCVAPSMGMH